MSIQEGKPGTISNLPEQVARMIREERRLRDAEAALSEARSTLAAREGAVRFARQSYESCVRNVGDLATRAGWVDEALIKGVRP